MARQRGSHRCCNRTFSSELSVTL